MSFQCQLFSLDYIPKYELIALDAENSVHFEQGIAFTEIELDDIRIDRANDKCAYYQSTFQSRRIRSVSKGRDGILIMHINIDHH